MQDDSEIRAALEAAIKEAGSAVVFANKHGFSPQWVSDLRYGRRKFTLLIAQVLGFKYHSAWVKEEEI